MISDLTNGDSGALVPHAPANDVLAALNDTARVQPVRDVPAYLATRRPQPEIAGEEHLLITLPRKLQEEVRALVRACKLVAGLVKQKFSVQSACAQALATFDRWPWKLNTFRPKYDLWAQMKDWVVLVNRAKAPASWKAATAGLPPEFLAHCETKFGRFGREDGKRQALLAIKRHWRTGRDEDGHAAPIPGYEAGWNERDITTPPSGWHYTNILREVKKRARFTAATRALLHEGESAAREFLPQVLQTRAQLRFLEKVTFDDVRCDWLIFNPATRAAEELWLLVARDEATAMVLGFVCHPASVREDGRASHLGAQQMKELAAYLLERYPLPPYLVHWVVERGTATLREGVQAALAELLDARIRVHYTSMIGSKSPAGYLEKRKGNSRGKASHEAHNRLLHTMASYLPGQTGANWGIRPADLEARVAECNAIYATAQTLPAERQNELQLPLLTLAQARTRLMDIFTEQNFRKEHSLEGFEKIVVEQNGALVTRMEMPVERAVRLIRSVEKWEHVSPEIIRTFLEHTQRRVEVNARGEIEFTLDGRKIYFQAPAGAELVPGHKCLAYHHSADPQFLHLTSGDGRILGTWVQRGRGAYLDQEALAEAMRYTHAARTAARTVAAELATPERERLDAMRRHNAEIHSQFNVVTDAPSATGTLHASAVGAAMLAASATKADLKTNPVPPPVANDCTEELLQRAKKVPAAADEEHWD